MEAVTAEVAVLLPLHQPDKDAAWAPVYPGFVFVRFDRVDLGWRVLVDADRGWRLLGPDQEHPAVVPDADVERMRQLYGPEGSNGGWKPPPPRPSLSVGSRVMVADGPLTSFPGKVVADRGERVTVAVEIFGRMTDYDLPREAVEPA